MKKISIVIIEIFMVLLSLNITVHAQSSTGINMAIPEKAQKGENIKLTFEIENANIGINGIQGKLEFDKDVLEYLNSKALVEGWEITGFNKETGIFLVEPTNIADTDKYIIGTKGVIEVWFKVKENVSVEETNIKISEVVLSGDNVENNEITKKVNIKTDIDTDSGIETEKIINADTKKYESSNNGGTIIKGNALPNTGINSIFVFIALTLIIVIAFLYIKVKQYKDI